MRIDRVAPRLLAVKEAIASGVLDDVDQKIWLAGFVMAIQLLHENPELMPLMWQDTEEAYADNERAHKDQLIRQCAEMVAKIYEGDEHGTK